MSHIQAPVVGAHYPKLFQFVRLLAAVLVVLSLVACSEDKPVAPVPEVAVVPVVKQDVPIYMELVGQTIGSLDIAIRARVDGQLEGLHFKEGQPVKKDQLLYTIDPKPFEAKVAGSESLLAEAVTALTKAESDLKRVEPLAKINAVSQRDLDAAVAARDAAQASVEAAEAQVEYSNITLGYTRIHSPLDGLIGITKAKVGDYVGKEPNPIVLNMVSQTDPIHVRVTLSEKEYLQFARRYKGQEEKKQKKGELQLILADGSLHRHKGAVHAVDSSVDAATGTLTIEASFPNGEKILRPGQYAKVKAVQEVREGALIVWQRAVQELQSIFQVYVVTPENKVEVRQVTPGPKLEGVWIIEKGLKEGDRVIVEGLQRIRPGAEVLPKTPAELEVTPPDTELAKLAGSDKETPEATATTAPEGN